MDHDLTSFACGCALTADVFTAAKELDKFVEQDKEHCAFVFWIKNEWTKASFAGAWTAIAMATIKPEGKERTVIAISAGGAYWEYQTKTMRNDHGGIKTAKQSLRSLTAINDVIYACGMGRSVLRRKSCGVWSEIGPGASPADKGLVVGFEGLAGFSNDDLYAVGWIGEIWHSRKGKWRRVKTPTQANLNAVCCAPDGQVYAVGDNGVMLRGRDDRWDLIETNKKENLMSVAPCGDGVYVSTDFEILKVNGETLVSEDCFTPKKDRPKTCLQLCPIESALYSLGAKDLFRLQDGLWKRIV